MLRELTLTAAMACAAAAIPAAAQVVKGSIPPTSTLHAAAQTLDAAQQKQLQAMIAQHERVRAKLSPSDRKDLDKLTAKVRRQLFASPRSSDLLGETSGIVSRMVPGLSNAEAGTLAEYTLGGIASGGAATGGAASGGSAIGSASGGDEQAQLLAATQQMQETQMSFNLQYLQLQSQMQEENRSYTAVSNIMKTKHHAVKNSISNIR